MVPALSQVRLYTRGKQRPWRTIASRTIAITLLFGTSAGANGAALSISRPSLIFCEGVIYTLHGLGPLAIMVSYIGTSW